MDADNTFRDHAALAITQQHTAPGVTVVQAAGEVDQVTAPDLSTAISGALDSSEVVVLDLSGISFLGSAGLAVLVEAATRAEKGAQQLRLVASGAPVLRPLALTGLSTVLSVHPTREAAVESLQRESAG